MRTYLIVAVALVMALTAASLYFRPRPVKLRSQPAAFFPVNETDQRGAIGRHVRRLLEDGRFDAVEALADSFAENRSRMASGRLKLYALYDFGFEGADRPASAEDWVSLLGWLREWNEARPESFVAPLAVAYALEGRAWEARGSAAALLVPPRDFERFDADLAEARDWLQRCPPESRRRPEWRRSALRVLHATGPEADSVFRELLAVCLRDDPDEYTYYLIGSMHLLPRWYGAPGDVERFVDSTTAALPDSIADEYYARVVSYLAPLHGNVFDDLPGLSWPRTVRGLRQWKRNWPRSSEPLSRLASLARERDDVDETRQAFVALGDTLDFSVWESGAEYWLARQWAEEAVKVAKR